MKEIEVKAKVEDLSLLKSKLISLGCQFSEPLLQNDRIYLHRSIKFSEIKPGTAVVRLREVNGKFKLTVKKSLENELSKLERESLVENGNQVNDIIKLLDFEEVLQVKKNREKCQYRDYTICLDDVENLGTFIEVEKMTKDEDSLQVQDELAKFLIALDIPPENRVTMGYDTLLYNKLHQ